MTTRHGVSFTAAYEEAMGVAPIEYAMLDCYELRHSGFVDGFGAPFIPRVVNDFQDMTAKLEANAPANAGELVTFTAMAISAGGLDESDNSQAPSISLAFDGVSPLLVTQLDYAIQGLEPVNLTVRVYASNDLMQPAFTPVIHLILRDVTVTETRVTAKAAFYDPSNRGFPRVEYTSKRYPGLSSR